MLKYKKGPVPIECKRYSNGRVDYTDPINRTRAELKRNLKNNIIKPVFTRSPGKTISAFS
jgi:hypothetical protein